MYRDVKMPLRPECLHVTHLQCTVSMATHSLGENPVILCMHMFMNEYVLAA